MHANDSCCPVKLYQKFWFDPFDVFSDGLSYKYIDDPVKAVGKVTYINYGHQWFLIEFYSPDGLKQTVSFKFCDIGDCVFRV